MRRQPGCLPLACPPLIQPALLRCEGFQSGLVQEDYHVHGFLHLNHLSTICRKLRVKPSQQAEDLPGLLQGSRGRWLSARVGIYPVSVVVGPGGTRPGRGTWGLKRVNSPLNAVKFWDVVYVLIVKVLLYVEVLHCLGVLRELGV